MNTILEIWDNDTNNFIKVAVKLKRSKGFKEIFNYARQNIITEFGENKYCPYWFEGLDIENKDWFRGGFYRYDSGLINLSLKGKNVEGVILNGNELYILESVKKINQ